MTQAYRPYLNARISIFAHRLLRAPDYVTLLEAGEGTLRGGVENPTMDFYLGLFAGTGAAPEQEMLDRVLADFQVLLRPVLGNDRAFLVFAVRWFEIANLKALIRGKFAGLDEQEVAAQLLDVGHFTQLPLTDLLRADEPMEMLRRLEHTAYAGIVRQARRTFEEEQDLFSLDAAIDRQFFVGLAQRARAVSGDEQAAMSTLLGSLLDRFNLLWLLRYRFAYGFSPAKTYYLLAATGRRLTSDVLLALAKLDSVEAVVAALPPGLHARLEGVSEVTDIETRIDQENREVAIRALSNPAHPVTRCLAYMILREGEMRGVLAILKGRRLGMDEPSIRLAVGMEA